MTYDEGLAERLRELLPGEAEKRMFGGVGWLVDGNMLVGVMGDEMLARVGPDATAAALKQPGVKRFKPGPSPMKGWVLVAQDELPEDEDLERWIKLCRAFVQTLPAK